MQSAVGLVWRATVLWMLLLLFVGARQSGGLNQFYQEKYMSREVVVLSAVRSAIGTFGGALADFEPTELAGIVMKEAVVRSGVDPKQINYVTVGN